MTDACPYCEKEVKARGRKNHVRLMSGDGHGDKGELPADYEEAIEAPDDSVSGEEADDSTNGPEDTEAVEEAADGPDTEAQEVTADDLGNTEPDVPESADGDGNELPFDPDAEGAIELDGTETLYVRHQGEIQEAPVEAGDWLLVTPDGPVLYDPDTDHRFEVVTE